MEGLDNILAEAEAAGVTGIVSVSETLEDAGQVFDHIDIFQDIFSQNSVPVHVRRVRKLNFQLSMICRPATATCDTQ